jgi:glycosyltransferase involved in cell wall biosynthesis
MLEPSKASLAVVIPTYNREATLRMALDAYRSQSKPQLIKELLVVDDGSTDKTEAAVREFTRKAPFPVRYLWQPNRGPAAARNLGIKEARTEIILFTDSDIIPQRDLVCEHLGWHWENPQLSVAVLGYVTWAQELNPTPFMRWCGEVGPLFSYGKLRHKQAADFLFCYTCNLSIKTDFLKRCGGFDEDFKGAAFEDTELGYRLAKAGSRLLYNAHAVAYHYQFYSFADTCRKAQANLGAARIFFQKEAGKHVLERRKYKQSRLWYRIAGWAAKGLAIALNPARRLLDSHFPLPSIVYRLFFWYDAIRHLDYSASENHPVQNCCYSSTKVD